jgi:hypothetical protein
MLTRAAAKRRSQAPAPLPGELPSEVLEIIAGRLDKDVRYTVWPEFRRRRVTRVAPPKEATAWACRQIYWGRFPKLTDLSLVLGPADWGKLAELVWYGHGDGLFELKSLTLKGDECHKEDMEAVSTLENLERLTLRYLEAEQESLLCLARLTRLQHLSMAFRNEDMTAGGLDVILKGMPDLRALELGQMIRLGDEALGKIAQRTPRLVSLSLHWDQLSNASMALLAPLVCLEELTMYRPAWGLTGLSGLAAFPMLRSFVLEGCFYAKIQPPGLHFGLWLPLRFSKLGDGYLAALVDLNPRLLYRNNVLPVVGSCLVTVVE